MRSIDASSPEIVRTESRPRCFEHGCDGRAFCSIENYKRHLREKNGLNVTLCILCNKQFTRKSNMDKHMADGRCGLIRAIREIEQAVLSVPPFEVQWPDTNTTASLGCKAHSDTVSKLL